MRLNLFLLIFLFLFHNKKIKRKGKKIVKEKKNFIKNCERNNRNADENNATIMRLVCSRSGLFLRFVVVVIVVVVLLTLLLNMKCL